MNYEFQPLLFIRNIPVKEQIQSSLMFNAGTTFNIYTDVKEVVIRANEKIYDTYINAIQYVCQLKLQNLDTKLNS